MGWLRQPVSDWVVEPWTCKDGLAFGAPCSNESSIHKLSGARADKA